MDTEVDLTTADRAVLIAIIAQLQATVLEQQRVIERLQRRIAELEGQAKPGVCTHRADTAVQTRPCTEDWPAPRMPEALGHAPSLKAKSGRKPPAQPGPRKQRRHGFARRRMTPTRQVEHVVERCPDCGTQLSGGWTQRTREVIELPQVPAEVTEHVYIARNCPACRRRCLPPAELDGVVLGQQRLGVNLLSLIATLREEARLPIAVIQRYLDTVHQLRLSVGAIVSAIHRTAQRAQPVVARIVDRIRASPVVHADETGWRQDGNNGYVWTFSTPTQRYFLRRGRGKAVVDEVLGEGFAGVLVSDFYAAYHHYDGPKQRCWAHLLRDIHDLRALYPDDAPGWPGGPTPSTGFTTGPKPALIPRPSGGAPPQVALERQLLAICQPFLDDPSATQAKLCRRIERHIKELFVFVAEPEAPADNNAAERSLRHLVVSRKISGGTRSEQGTESKMTLAYDDIFGTWRAQGLNRSSPPAVSCSFPLYSELLPIPACRNASTERSRSRQQKRTTMPSPC